MLTAKKLLFAVPFLILFLLFTWGSTSLLSNPYLILFIDLPTLVQILVLLIFLTLANICFVSFALFANNYKLALPVLILVSLVPLLVLGVSAGIFLSLSLLAFYLLIFSLLRNKLGTYLNFQPTVLLGPSVKQLTTLMIIGLSLVYYNQSSKIIQEQGVVVPEQLVEIVSNMPQFKNVSSVDTPITQSIEQITPADLQKLRQNPEQLKQMGLDESLIDEIEKLQNQAKKSGTKIATEDSSKVFLRALINNQVQKTVAPIKGFLPIIFTALFFITLHSLASIIGILVSPILWLLYLFLEKVGFTQFQTEQRTVKKLVV